MAQSITTLKQFCIDNQVTAISNVRANQNGLLYSTFIINGEALNIYFSKNAGALVTEGDKPTVFKNLFVALAEYKDGREARWKISTNSSGNYTAIADMW